MGELVAAGFGPFVGVPCSALAPLIIWCEQHSPQLYRAANNEGEAVAIGAGCALAGTRPVVMLQNSGLGNAVNPLTSLCDPMRIPLLLLVTWRGQPGRRDEAQHLLMGRITQPLLDQMEIPYEVIATDDRGFAEQVSRLSSELHARSAPCALVIPDGSIRPEPVNIAPSPHPRRRDAIAAIVGPLSDDVVVVSTTGKTSRELATDWDRQANFYVVGSMGCAASVALGIAISAPECPVVVLDGDGAALMRLEAMVSIGAWRPRRFIHILLDNAAYESTGGQRTNSPTVDLGGVARACGYASIHNADGLPDAMSAIEQTLATDGPHFIRIAIAVGSDPALGRPTRPPAEVARNLSELLLASRDRRAHEPSRPA